MASQRAKILVLAVVVGLTGLGGAFALATGDSPDAVPTTGPFTQTTDPSREDYYDQFDHAVPYLKISHAAEEAFGPRFGDVAIDRDVEPNVLRVYVVDPTADDEAELTRIADGNPQVALQPADFTWRELLAAKDAVVDVAMREDLTSYSVAPDLIAQGVEVASTKQLDPDVEARIRSAAGSVPVRFKFGPEHKLRLL